MTIYSQHPNRGKVQILATYRSPVGVTSSTITSLGNEALAFPIVSALNRISTYATLPLSVHDTRDGFTSYPTDHLDTIGDASARAELLTGAHSLWYEYIKLLLHDALADLDEAIQSVPEPIRLAINAELEQEERNLRDAWAEYTQAVEPPETNDRREWDFGNPFVVFEDGMPSLDRWSHDQFDRSETDASEQQLQQGVADMRMLIKAYEQCIDGEARIAVDHLSITSEPYGADRYFLTVEAPLPGDDEHRTSWQVDISRWDVDLDDPEYENATAHGETTLVCTLPSAPTPDQITELINRSERPEQLIEWAKTDVGKPLAGTTFIVTDRYDD